MAKYPSPMRGIFATRSLEDLLAQATDREHGLRRALGPIHVTLLGVGAIVGAGIFATIGTAAAGDAARPGAGPSIILSFIITAVVCGLTALCYAEMAAMVPIAGSAYTYAYATMGELLAWIIGWDLIIEYAVGNVAVAISWANYFRTFLGEIGIHIPAWMATDYRTAARIPGIYEAAPHLFGIPVVFNLLAFLIVGAITVVLVWGIKESASFNAGMVLVKILVLFFFVGFALWLLGPRGIAVHWHPFQPNGWSGTLAGAAVVFFAFIGFDAVSTVAEETRRPSRDLPVGIIASLGLCTFLYIMVSTAFTGLIPYTNLVQRLANEQAEPLTLAIQHAAPEAGWATAIVALGSVVAHTAVLLVFQLGQPRIFFAMSRDGLLPPVFSRVHPRFRTPHVTTIITGVAVGSVAAVASIDEMVDLTNIGTLFAFVLVSLAIPILRFKDPHRHRPFRVPWGPWFLPLLSAVACVFLMVYLPPLSWWRFIGWLTLGLALFSAYGYAHSRLGRAQNRPRRTPGGLKVAAGGFLIIASGLFAMPHGRLSTLLDGLTAGGRVTAGALLILSGATLAALGIRRSVRNR